MSPRAPRAFSEGIWTLLAPTPVPPSQQVLGALGVILMHGSICHRLEFNRSQPSGTATADSGHPADYESVGDPVYSL